MNNNVILYLSAINLLSFVAIVLDRWRRQKGGWQFHENMLFLLAFFGGAVGMYAGMFFFRHRNREWAFLIGIPFCFLLNLFMIYPMLFWGVKDWFLILLYWAKRWLFGSQ
jgi:uncharacterized membrane protein YsdA (DUF1294 family)